MAGGGNDEDNPVAINVIPMVDVIFCLCVFFMCSFKLKQIEGKFDSWLPRNKGADGAPPPEIREIRIAMFWDETTSRVSRRFGMRTVDDDGEMATLIRGSYEDWRARGVPEVPVIIDGDERIPWNEVLKIVNIAKGLSIDNIEFALGKKDA